MSREVRRVPLDFDNGGQGLRQVWPGYLRPDDLDGAPCTECFDPHHRGGSDGNTPEVRAMYAQWYGWWSPGCPDAWEFTPDQPWGPETPEVLTFAQRNLDHSPGFYGTGPAALRREAVRLVGLFNSWQHHLAQVDVDALVADGRLRDFTHDYDPTAAVADRWTPHGRPVTADAVNRRSLRGGFGGHDSINAWVVIGARAKREGVPTSCPGCDGHGTVEAYPGQRDDAENWEPTQPPTGDGWQLWETTSEGSPVSEVFATDRELAHWLCTETGRCAVGFGGSRVGWDLAGALAFVSEGSSVASMVLYPNADGDGGVMVDGSVAAILDDQGRPPTSQTTVEQL